jgi:hypothetical protein
MRRTPFRIAALAAALVLLSLAPISEAGVMSVRPSGDGKQIDVRLPLFKERLTSRLVELVDASGTVVRTLYAGRASQEQELTLTPRLGVPAGKYTLRYRHGLDLELAGRLEHPNAPTEKWVNPVHVVFAPDATYVMEAGFGQPNAPEPSFPGPRITKLTRDGKIDTTFGKDGRLQLRQDHPTRTRSFLLSPEGSIFITSTYHEVMVFDDNGRRLSRNVGGWNNKPFDELCTGWATSPALGLGNRIYIPTGYGNMKVYDRSKSGFDGALSMIKIDTGNGLERSTVVSERGDLYMIGSKNTITRFKDEDGKLKIVHVSEPPAGLASATGPWVGADQLWLVDHGPSAGPFWDSGGGGEVLLFWDDGTGCQFVQRFGRLGTSEDGVEFFSPSCVVVSPDHQEIWVVEDGTKYAEGPSGTARIRKFRVTADVTEEVAVDLSAWKP